MRKLKYHESRLLRKSSFTSWDPKISNLKTSYHQFLQSRYYINDFNTINTYSNLKNLIRKTSIKIAKLKNTNFKKQLLIKKLIKPIKDLKIIPKVNLESCFDVKIEDICERRISNILVKNKMVENLRDAVKFVEQGHVSIGVKVVSDGNVLVSEEMEKYVRWSYGSKIKRKVDEFNEGVDDYDNHY